MNVVRCLCLLLSLGLVGGARPPFIGIWTGTVNMLSGGDNGSCTTGSCGETCTQYNVQSLGFSTDGANITAQLSYTNGFPLGTCSNKGLVTAWNASFIEVAFDCGPGQCFTMCPPSPAARPSIPICFYYQPKDNALAFAWLLEVCPKSSGYHPPPGCPTSLQTWCQVPKNGCWLTKVVMTPA